MHHQNNLNSGNYNWYSTNSLRRYNNRATENPPNESLDAGRISLGSYTDASSVQMRNDLLESVTEETLQLWEEFRKEMREKSPLGKVQSTENRDERYRTYPEKKHDYDLDPHAASDASQPRSECFTTGNPYVLNRKKYPTPIPATSSAPLSQDDTNNDQIFVDDRTPSNPRWIVSGNEAMGDQSSQKSSSLILTTVRECVLHKYGHCFDPTVCRLAHEGKVTHEEGKSLCSFSWPLKPQNVPICPGYLDLSCWDSNCQLRHAIYANDEFSE